LTTLPEVIKNFDNLSKGIKFRSYNPWVYNLEGINMLATILKSDIAVLRAIQNDTYDTYHKPQSLVVAGFLR
jgi:hypothetical protein